MNHHVLKCWPVPFSETWAGYKPYEYRRNDRGFAVGDWLTLREWVPGAWRDEAGYTGREIAARVVNITPCDEWGGPRDFCVLGLSAKIHHFAAGGAVGFINTYISQRVGPGK